MSIGSSTEAVASVGRFFDNLVNRVRRKLITKIVLLKKILLHVTRSIALYRMMEVVMEVIMEVIMEVSRIVTIPTVVKNCTKDIFAIIRMLAHREA